MSESSEKKKRQEIIKIIITGTDDGKIKWTVEPKDVHSLETVYNVLSTIQKLLERKIITSNVIESISSKINDVQMSSQNLVGPDGKPIMTLNKKH